MIPQLRRQLKAAEVNEAGEYAMAS